MLFRFVYSRLTSKFAGGLDEAISGFAATSDSAFRLDETSISDMCLSGFLLYEKASEMERSVKKAFAVSIMMWLAVFIATITLPINLYAASWILICLGVSLDILDARSIECNARRHAVKTGLHYLSKATEKLVVAKKRSLLRKVFGYVGEFESSDDDAKWKPYEWFELGIKGSCLVLASSGSELPWKVLRFVNEVGKYGGQVGNKVSKLLAPKRRSYGLGFVRWGSSHPPEIPMQTIGDDSTLSDRLLLRRSRRHFISGAIGRWIRAKVFMCDHGGALAATFVSVALLGLAGKSLATGRWSTQKSPAVPKVSNTISGKKQKNQRPTSPTDIGRTHEGSFHGIEEGAVASAIKRYVFGDIKSSCNGFSPEMVTAHTELNARVVRCQKAVKADSHNRNLRYRLSNAQAAYDKLWADCMACNPDTASFTPKPTVLAPTVFNMRRVSGLPESKGDNKPYKHLKKSGKTSDGNKYWAYDDELGNTAWFYEIGEGAMFDGDEYELLEYMGRRGDYFDDEELNDPLYSQDFTDRRGSRFNQTEGPSRSKPETASAALKSKLAKKEKKVVPKMESSLNKCGVRTADVRMLMLRNKSNHTLYQNAPIIDAKVLVYRHTFGNSEDSVSKNRTEFEFWDPVKQVAFPLSERFVQLTTIKEIVCFPVPEGYKSNSFQRGELEGTHGEGVVAGYDSHDCRSLTLASGEIRTKNTRHTCATKPGWCGSLVLTNKGNSPKLCGLHIFGDDGTDTNGYYAFTKELNAELREVKWPKN